MDVLVPSVPTSTTVLPVFLRATGGGRGLQCRRSLASVGAVCSSSEGMGFVAFASAGRRWRRDGRSSRFAALGGGGGGAGEEEARKEREDQEVERALGMDGSIPRSSEEFVRRVSSRAYGMRRDLQQSLDSISYDVLDTNPWRGDPKPVYVLTQRENQLWTMKTRQSRSEVEKELGLLFSRGTRQSKNSGGFKFRMLVEDIREGVLVFEDEQDAARYCDLLQGGGQGCEGVAEVEASSVFDVCHKMRALAVLFRRGRTPPLPENLQLNLRARKRSLEDQEDLA